MPSSVGTQVESTKRNGGYVLIPEGKGKTDLEWTIHYAKQVPGPDAYRPRTSMGLMRTGKFSTAAPPTYLDRIITEASRKPGPNDYNIGELDSIVNKPGGVFSTSCPKTYIELEEYRSKSIPGPSAYDPKLFNPNNVGGQFSEARPKSNLDWIIYYAASKPGPNKYNCRGQTRYGTRSIGGKFGNSKIKSFIDLEIQRVSDHPAGCDYNLVKFPKLDRKLKKRWRKYSNTDDLTTQLKTLDKMARSPIGKYGKKRRKRKKKKKKNREYKTKNVYNVHDEDANFLDVDMEEHPQATKKLLQYKVMKLEDIYDKYT